MTVLPRICGSSLAKDAPDPEWRVIFEAPDGTKFTRVVEAGSREEAIEIVKRMLPNQNYKLKSVERLPS